MEREHEGATEQETPGDHPTVDQADGATGEPSGDAPPDPEGDEG